MKHNGIDYKLRRFIIIQIIMKVWIRYVKYLIVKSTLNVLVHKYNDTNSLNRRKRKPSLIN